MSDIKKNDIPLEQASAQQLREYASITMGLEIPARANGPTILSKMRQAGFDNDHITLVNVAGPATTIDRAAANEAEVKADIASGEREFVKILIQTDDRDGGDEPVPVSVNGRMIWIPRGKEVTVAIEYVEALFNAVQYIYPEYSGEGLGGLQEARRVQSYPFSRLGAA